MLVYTHVSRMGNQKNDLCMHINICMYVYIYACTYTCKQNDQSQERPMCTFTCVHVRVYMYVFS